MKWPKTNEYFESHKKGTDYIQENLNKIIS